MSTLSDGDLEAWEYYNEVYKSKQMGLNDYQKAASRTAIYKAEHSILYPALGLAGEAGEVSNKVKKMLRDGNFDKQGIADGINHMFADIIQVHKGPHFIASLTNCVLVVVVHPVKNAINKFLYSGSNDTEKKQNGDSD